MFALCRCSSMDLRGNLARAIQMFLAAGVDPGQSDDSLESVATLHDAHLWGQGHFYGTPHRNIVLAY